MRYKNNMRQLFAFLVTFLATLKLTEILKINKNKIIQIFKLSQFWRYKEGKTHFGKLLDVQSLLRYILC